jgi:hypothetical protein
MTESWTTPFLVRLNHVNWKLSDAIMRRYNTVNTDFTGDYHVAWSRYVKAGYSTYTYELYCMIYFGKAKEPDALSQSKTIHELQTFISGFLADKPEDETPEEADEPYQRPSRSA